MTRIGKQEERRHRCPKKRKPNLSKKTGPKKDELKGGFKPQINAVTGEFSESVFIAKISK